MTIQGFLVLAIIIIMIVALVKEVMRVSARNRSSWLSA